jgi:hypothetical protein
MVDTIARCLDTLPLHTEGVQVVSPERIALCLRATAPRFAVGVPLPFARRAIEL